MNESTLTVGELGGLLRGALEHAFPYGVWVQGEISGLTRARNGHVYFDLVEPADPPGPQPEASVSVVLFRDARDRVNRLLKRHGDPIRMSDGVRIRIQAMPDFYPPSGRLQIRMTAIDPTYTIGRLAAEREALLRRLSAEGLLERNGATVLTPIALRVGLVTSVGSAAHADVLTVFDRSGLAFELVVADSAVQGRGAESAVVAGIDAVAAVGVDIVLVVRGGGSRTDLATFDHELIARAIASCPIPVHTGIGHDIDRSVADDVAHHAHTTPTAAAQAVVARAERWLAELDRTGAAIARRAREVLQVADRCVAGQAERARSRARSASEQAGRQLDTARDRLVVVGRLGVRSADRRLARATTALTRRAPRVLGDCDRTLEVAATRLKALDPAVTMARGWSITRRVDGTVVTSIDDVGPGETILSVLADGTLTSTIEAAHDSEAGDDRQR